MAWHLKTQKDLVLSIDLSKIATNCCTLLQIAAHCFIHIQHWKRARISVPICLSKHLEPAKTATGRSKQLGKINWDWDTRSLSLVSALLPAVASYCCRLLQIATNCWYNAYIDQGKIVEIEHGGVTQNDSSVNFFGNFLFILR